MYIFFNITPNLKFAKNFIGHSQVVATNLTRVRCLSFNRISISSFIIKIPLYSVILYSSRSITEGTSVQWCWSTWRDTFQLAHVKEKSSYLFFLEFHTRNPAFCQVKTIIHIGTKNYEYSIYNMKKRKFFHLMIEHFSCILVVVLEWLIKHIHFAN